MLVAACASADERAAPATRGAAASTAGATPVAIGPGADSLDATTIVGKPAPPWTLDWMGAPPITVEALRGKVVLVRWFTGGCPYCSSSAPTLAALHDELAPRGLAILGVYHHKSSEPLDPGRVRALADELGFHFPIAIDHDWRTLRSWWLDDHEGWTSVSFLIDRRGVVRFVHTGGAYAPGSEGAAQVRRWLDALLAEPA